MKCSHSQCSNSFVFMFILSNFTRCTAKYSRRGTTNCCVLNTEWGILSVYIRNAGNCVDWDSSAGPDRTGPKTRRRQRHEHVSVPIFVILFCLLFSLLWLRKFENVSCIGSSNCPTAQTVSLSIHPFICLSLHPSIQRFAFVHQMLSRGSYFWSVHKYLARQLHLALSRRRLLSALVCIISNLLNIFHIINFNYLCSLSRSFFFLWINFDKKRQKGPAQRQEVTRRDSGGGKRKGSTGLHCL